PATTAISSLSLHDALPILSDAPSPQGILPTAPRSAVRRWLSRTVAVLYGLVMFEVIIMISPFAFYFYAAYGPTLKWLNHSRATADRKSTRLNSSHLVISYA